MADRTRIILPPKAERKRAAHAGLLLMLSMAADSWTKQLRGQDNALPFELWPEDDPLRALARSYSLTAEDLARLADTLAQQLEDRAIRAGYGELPPAD